MGCLLGIEYHFQDCELLLSISSLHACPQLGLNLSRYGATPDRLGYHWYPYQALHMHCSWLSDLALLSSSNIWDMFRATFVQPQRTAFAILRVTNSVVHHPGRTSSFSHFLLSRLSYSHLHASHWFCYPLSGVIGEQPVRLQGSRTYHRGP